MKTFTLVGLILLALPPMVWSSIVSVKEDPNVREGKTLFDLRDVDKSLREREDVETHYSTSNIIDLSAKNASVKFKEILLAMNIDGERNLNMRYDLHTNLDRDEGSNRFLVEWSLENNNDGTYTLRVRLRVLDLNNTQLENGVQESVLNYTCKYFEIVNEHVCVPEKCNFDEIKPPTDPVKKCVNNYRESQMVLSVVNESTSTQQPKVLGEQTQQLIVYCMQKQIETLVIHGETVCYFEGFKPENMVTYEEMRNSIMANGDWVETETAGTFQRSTVIKEWVIDSLIDTSVPELISEHQDLLTNVDPDTIQSIYDQLDYTDIDMTKGTTVEASGTLPE